MPELVVSLYTVELVDVELVVDVVDMAAGTVAAAHTVVAAAAAVVVVVVVEDDQWELPDIQHYCSNTRLQDQTTSRRVAGVAVHIAAGKGQMQGRTG